MCQRTNSVDVFPYSHRAHRNVAHRKRGEKEAINYHDPSEFDLRVSRAFLSQAQHLLPHCRNVAFVDVISPSLRRDSERKKELECAGGWIKTILLSRTDLHRFSFKNKHVSNGFC